MARDGERVDLLHAPTMRAQRTVEVIGESLHKVARDGGKTVVVRMLGSDEGFANVRVFAAGRGREPTQLRAEQRRLAALPQPHPGWVTESGRFWQADATPGGAMTCWLTNPLLWHESPADVIRRLLRTAQARASAVDAGSWLVVATHSGCLRALVAWASGTMPTEPPNGDAVTLQIDDDQVIVAHAGVQWRMHYPTEPLHCSAGPSESV